jgi:propionyl-CoA carboxylase alpha chain
LPEDALRDLAALAAHIHVVAEGRAAQVSGTMPYHQRQVGRDWVVMIDRKPYPLALDNGGQRSDVTWPDGTLETLACAWTPGQRLARARIDGREVVAKVNPIEGGMRLRHRGADLKVSVFTPRNAELAARMPVKLPPDTSKFLLCPMPGLVVRIDVAEGDEVFDGQTLAMVEAMKMENVLRAERKAVVKKVCAKAGDSLAVDDVILEFE